MTLFDELFYSGPMLAVFSDESRLQRMLDFESALASAQGSLGLIPAEAAEVIAQSCKTEHLDLVALREGAGRAGNLAIPLVKQLTTVVDGISPIAARYIHWGATSQDTIDTGMVLQMREALRLIDGQLQRLNESLAEIADRHAATTMPGRTWLQQAVPITFGLKAAGWLDSMLRHQVRLRELSERSLVLQLGGAAGTLASLGAHGPAVSRRLAGILGLGQADISWHSSRDRFAEIVAALGILVASLGKIARDLAMLMQTEVSEVSEAAGQGRGGSSTMPHKRNPVLCSVVLAASGRVPGLVATVLISMGQEHERGLGNWQVEWETIPEIFNLCGGALEKMSALVAGLQVDRDRMTANLELTQGLIYAEAVAMTVSEHLGKPAAHVLIERLCQIAIESKRHLRDVLGEEKDVMRLLTPTGIERLFDPAQHLGNSRNSIDQVLIRASACGVATQSGWIESAEAHIHFKCSGAHDLPVLVLANSVGSDLTMWDTQLAAFARHFRIVRYDTRGHGLSTATPGSYSIELLARDAIAVLDALGIASCNFCGLSMGGMIGQWLGLNAASRVRKLVLCNTAARIGARPTWDERIAAVQKAGMGSIVPAVLDRYFTAPFLRSHPGLMAKTRAMIEATSLEGYVGCCAALRDTDLRELVKDIGTPVLVIAGTHDPATPVVNGRFLAETIPGARLIELSASHLSNVEADQEFNAAVLKFLLG